MEDEKREKTPAIQQYADLIAAHVAETKTGEYQDRDRRLEGLDWVIKETAEELRDYLQAEEEWQLAYNAQRAIGSLDQGMGGPPMVGTS